MLTAIRFHASWCNPCHQYAPVFNDFVADKHILATDVDIDQYPLTKDDYKIMSVPTTVAVLDGEEIFRLVGVQTAAELESAFAPYLSATDNA